LPSKDSIIVGILGSVSRFKDHQKKKKIILRDSLSYLFDNIIARLIRTIRKNWRVYDSLLLILRMALFYINLVKLPIMHPTSKPILRSEHLIIDLFEI